MKGVFRLKKNKLLLGFVILVYAFLFIPVVIIFFTSFTESNHISFPPEGFSFKWYKTVFTTASFVKSFRTSFETSILATLFAILIGLPGAYALSRFNFRGKTALKSFFMTPKIIPAIVAGFALFQFIVVKIQMPIYSGLLLGLIIFETPYALRVIGSSLDNFDYAIEEASMSLGSNRLTTFFRVVLPNISSGIIATFMLSFISAFNHVPIALFLTGPGVNTLPISMMNYVEYNYDPTVSALSVLLMLMTVGIMFIVEKTIGLSNL